MTHDEACELVEQSLERAVATLAYIRKRLDKRKTMTRIQQEAVKSYDILNNINFYGAYLQGARKMYLALMENKLLDIEYDDDKWKSEKERKMTKKSMLNCFMESTRNMEWLLHGIPQGVEMLTRYEVDKNNKIKSAKSEFRKEVINYEKI